VTTTLTIKKKETARRFTVVLEGSDKEYKGTCLNDSSLQDSFVKARINGITEEEGSWFLRRACTLVMTAS
jgi:hypothetical protein